MKRQEGWVVWLTGLPAAGKTTVAQAMQEQLHLANVNTILLDSDEVRQALTPTASYTPEERDFFYSGLVGLAAILARQGVNVIIAATGNRRHYRAEARRRLAHFMEVWVQCPLAVCQARDPKGLYAQASSPKHRHLPGVGAQYEAPDAADVIVDTSQQTPAQSAQQIIAECGLYTRQPISSSSEGV